MSMTMAAAAAAAASAAADAPVSHVASAATACASAGGGVKFEDVLPLITDKAKRRHVQKLGWSCAFTAGEDSFCDFLAMIQDDPQNVVTIGLGIKGQRGTWTYGTMADALTSLLVVLEMPQVAMRISVEMGAEDVARVKETLHTQRTKMFTKERERTKRKKAGNADADGAQRPAASDPSGGGGGAGGASDTHAHSRAEGDACAVRDAEVSGSDADSSASDSSEADEDICGPKGKDNMSILKQRSERMEEGWALAEDKLRRTRDIVKTWHDVEGDTMAKCMLAVILKSLGDDWNRV
jgi:hypothetical protein